MSGFYQKNLLVELDLVTGIDIALQEYLYYNSDRFGALRTRTASDGMSRPNSAGSFIQRFGPYTASAILHDGSYRASGYMDTNGFCLEKQQPDGTWAQLILTEHECNALIDEALRSQGCSWLERETIYNALELFGWSAFDADRKTSTPPTMAMLARLTAPVV